MWYGLKHDFVPIKTGVFLKVEHWTTCIETI